MLRAAQVSSVVAACLARAKRPGWSAARCATGCWAAPARTSTTRCAATRSGLARRVADLLGGAFFTYSEAFSTYRVVLSGGAVDFAPLRGPTIEQDLAERDFTG